MSTFLGVFSEIEDQILADLKVVGDFMVQKYKQQVPVDTGRLKNSIKYAITKVPDGYRISIGYLIYGVFQDLGVNGTKVNRGSPFQFRSQTIGGRLPFAVRKSIAEKGLRAKNWTQLTPQEEEQINEKIQDLFGMDLDELFNTILKKTDVIVGT